MHLVSIDIVVHPCRKKYTCKSPLNEFIEPLNGSKHHLLYARHPKSITPLYLKLYINRIFYILFPLKRIRIFDSRQFLQDCVLNALHFVIKTPQSNSLPYVCCLFIFSNNNNNNIIWNGRVKVHQVSVYTFSCEQNSIASPFLASFFFTGIFL